VEQESGSIIEGIPTVFGEFPITISATNAAGTTSATLMLTVHDSPLALKLLNISTRAAVLTGDKVLIGGFIVTGNEPKRVVLRAIGPSLPVFGLPVHSWIQSLSYMRKAALS
jgi:hypothetical protein